MLDCAFMSACRTTAAGKIMISKSIAGKLGSAIVLLMSVGLCPAALAQRPALLLLPDAPAASTVQPAVQPAFSLINAAPSKIDQNHKFWDKQNYALFAASAALSAADFVVTRSNLQNGGREMNPVVRIFGNSTTGLAVNFIGENVGVMSVSYFFHKTGHHKLERAVSMVNMGASSGAVAYSLTHR
jgi:hypothetical protein